MQHKFIVVIGNVASGKSTLAKKLAKKLGGEFVPADELYKVNPFFPLAVEDRKRWSLASDLWFLKERVKLAREAEEKLQERRVVVDSGLPMSWVYANSRLESGYFIQEEWELYKELYGLLTKKVKVADMVVYLKADVEYLLGRIEKRGREFEVKNHSREYLESIESSIERYVELKSGGDVLIVEGRINFGNVFEKVCSKL